MADNETTFGPHVNDVLERICHKSNIRVAISQELNSEDKFTLVRKIMRREPKKMKARKISKPFRD